MTWEKIEEFMARTALMIAFCAIIAVAAVDVLIVIQCVRGAR